MMDRSLAAGMRVRCRDAEWLVTRVEAVSQTGHFAVHCVGVDDLVRNHPGVFLTQLDAVEPVDPRLTRPVRDDSRGYRRARLFLEAWLRQMPACGTRPEPEGMGAFEPLPFQLEAVERALGQLRPRLLLADAVGLGKTIQVGMILSELMRRRRADRILVLTRKSMLAQFQSELWNRFGIPLVRLDSEGIAKLRLRIPANRNPFEVYQRIIISIDTLKNVGSYRHFLERTRWDCVVIDEAHNVAGASVPERHLSHRLARLLARRTDSLLLTTATPHNGRAETFGRLISLLDPSVISDPEYRQYTAEEIRGWFLMRFKEDVRAEAGRNLTDRQVVPLATTTGSASAAEEAVYQRLAEYRKAEGAPALLQYGLYKQFLSSPESCRKTVEARLHRLREEGVEDGAEAGQLAELRAVLGGMELAGSTRYELLKQQLREIGWDGSPQSPRLLVFTEYRETQEALAAALARDFGLDWSDRFEDQASQSLAIIHGSFPDVHLMKTVEAFGTGSSPVRLLLATDVASEGINLHHECHQIIHYDLPWSIITLIQRNGRIDRYGQQRSPVLRYLRVETSQPVLRGDAAIFERLIEKVEEINRATRSGESVLQLYDAAAEERYIAEAGLLKGDAGILDRAASVAEPEATELEKIIRDASTEIDDEMRRLLFGEEEPPVPASASQAEPGPRTIRRFRDRDYLLEGYRFLMESHPDFQPIVEQGPLMTIEAPPELQRRLGGPEAGHESIFGATAIPIEAWPERNQFRLTTDPARVELAIRAARQTSGYWSRELLCTNQHPILQWLTERLLMLLPRDECPLVFSPRLGKGELCFCFVGQVVSKGGDPVVVDAHAVSIQRGGVMTVRPLAAALDEAGLENLVNDAAGQAHEAMPMLIKTAVEASLAHLQECWNQQIDRRKGRLRQEQRRLKRWRDRRHEMLEDRIAQLGANHPRAIRDQQLIKEMELFLHDREENWLKVQFDMDAQAVTQMVLVIAG